MDTYIDPLATNTGAGIEPGDCVVVEDGKFRGCVLTVVREERGWFVCKNSYGVGGIIRTRRVTLRRKGAPEYARI